jgi:hypothetical protein
VSTHRTPGHRSAERPAAGRKPTPAVVLAVAAPVVATLALLVQAPADSQRETPDRPPATQSLTSQALGCPAALGRGGDLLLASAADQGSDGEVRQGAAGEDREPVALEPGGSVEPRASSGAVVVRAAGGLASALYGARFGRAAAGECVTPAGERWFAGVGSGASHLSTLQLVNPDSGPAVADVQVWSTDGLRDAPAAVGLTIRGGQRTVLDLERVAPHRDDLVIRVSVSRGRVAATVADSYVVGDAPSRDWVPTTAPPAATQVLPGLLRRAGELTLVLLNPGDSEARVDLRVVGRRSTFSPSGTEELRVPAGRVLVTELTDALARALKDEDASLQVDATLPVVAGLRSVAAGDVVHQAAVPPVGGRGAALVPGGGKSTLVLASGDVAGPVTITFVGPRTRTRALRLVPGTSLSLGVPAGTVSVLVEARVAYAGAVRTVGAGGAALLPLRPLLVDQLIPAVQAAWPPRSAR